VNPNRPVATQEKYSVSLKVYFQKNLDSMNLKKIAIGVDDFKLLIEQGSYFVDKSLFIGQLIEDAPPRA
jgi:hypothetical protein